MTSFRAIATVPLSIRLKKPCFLKTFFIYNNTINCTGRATKCFM